MRFKIFYKTSFGGLRLYNEIEAPDKETALAINFEGAKKQIPEDSMIFAPWVEADFIAIPEPDSKEGE